MLVVGKLELSTINKFQLQNQPKKLVILKVQRSQPHKIVETQQDLIREIVGSQVQQNNVLEIEQNFWDVIKRQFSMQLKILETDTRSEI